MSKLCYILQYIRICFLFFRASSSSCLNPSPSRTCIPVSLPCFLYYALAMLRRLLLYSLASLALCQTSEAKNHGSCFYKPIDEGIIPSPQCVDLFGEYKDGWNTFACGNHTF